MKDTKGKIKIYNPIKYSKSKNQEIELNLVEK